MSWLRGRIYTSLLWCILYQALLCFGGIKRKPLLQSDLEELRPSLGESRQGNNYTPVKKFSSGGMQLKFRAHRSIFKVLCLSSAASHIFLVRILKEEISNPIREIPATCCVLESLFVGRGRIERRDRTNVFISLGNSPHKNDF